MDSVDGMNRGSGVVLKRHGEYEWTNKQRIAAKVASVAIVGFGVYNAYNNVFGLHAPISWFVSLCTVGISTGLNELSDQ